MVTYYSVEVDYFISILHSMFDFPLLSFALYEYCAACDRQAGEALDWSREGERVEL